MSTTSRTGAGSAAPGEPSRVAPAFAGLTPGMVGVYQINAKVPFKGVQTGMSVKLTITQDGASTTLLVRVVN